MATSATHQSQTHEQIEYEQGFLVEDCVPCGAEAVPVCVKFDKKGNTLELTIATEDTHADEQRKPPLSEPGRSYAKSAGR